MYLSTVNRPEVSIILIITCLHHHFLKHMKMYTKPEEVLLLCSSRSLITIYPINYYLNT